MVQAIAAVRDMQLRGMRSIDVGCMQVNLMHHPDAFVSLEAAFDPAANAAYTAKFLQQLQKQSGSWLRATALYHFGNPELGAEYRSKVAAASTDEQPMINAGMGSIVPASPAESFLPPSRSRNAQMLPLAEGAGPGRRLAAYRLTPIAMISRFRRFGG